jgi:hypothetical protein
MKQTRMRAEVVCAAMLAILVANIELRSASAQPAEDASAPPPASLQEILERSRQHLEEARAECLADQGPPPPAVTDQSWIIEDRALTTIEQERISGAFSAVRLSDSCVADFVRSYRAKRISECEYWCGGAGIGGGCEHLIGGLARTSPSVAAAALGRCGLDW